MEGWSRQAKRDRDVLMRIVALLISMAGFADRAGGLRGRRRRQLFQLLHYAEAVGYDFIVGLMPASSAAYDEPDPTGDPEGPAGDAARLAASFRVLALVLYTMLQRRFTLGGAIPRHAPGRDPRFGEYKTLAERTAEWTPLERRAIHEIYVMWSKAWRP